MDEEDAMINASINAMFYKDEGSIKFIKKGNEIIGFWVKTFPPNTTKKQLLSMFCALHDETKVNNSPIQKAHFKILADKFKITNANGKDGFEIFLL